MKKILYLFIGSLTVVSQAQTSNKKTPGYSVLAEVKTKAVKNLNTSENCVYRLFLKQVNSLCYHTYSDLSYDSIKAADSVDLFYKKKYFAIGAHSKERKPKTPDECYYFYCQFKRKSESVQPCNTDTWELLGSYLPADKAGAWSLIQNYAESRFDDVEYLYPRYLAFVKQQGKWGMINQEGQIIIPIKYNKLFRQYPDRIFVNLNGKWGVFDYTGRQKMPFLYDKIGHNISTTENVLTLVKSKGKYGCIDSGFKLKIPLIYDTIYCIYPYTHIIGRRNGYVVLLDGESAAELTPLKYSRVENTDNYYLSLIDSQTQKAGLIDWKGKVLMEPEFQSIRLFYGVDIIAVEKDNLWALMERNGEILTGFLYTQIEVETQHWKKTTFKARINQKVTYLDESGKCVKDCDP